MLNFLLAVCCPGATKLWVSHSNRNYEEVRVYLVFNPFTSRSLHREMQITASCCFIGFISSSKSLPVPRASPSEPPSPKKGSHQRPG